MQFDMSQAWDDAMSMLSANRSMVMIVAGVFFFLPYMLLMILSPESNQAGLAPNPEDPEALFAAMSAAYARIWWLMIIIVLAQGVGTIALYALLGHANRPTVGEAIAFGFKGLLPFIGVAILQGLVFAFALGIPMGIAGALGSIAFISIVGIFAFVLTIYLYTKFSLSVTVLAMEQEFNPVRVLRRSWRLTKGNSLRLWLFYFLLIVAFLVVSIVITMVAGLIFGLMGSSVGLFGTGIVSSLLNAVFVCLFLAVIGAAYQQLSGGGADAIAETFE